MLSRLAALLFSLLLTCNHAAASSSFSELTDMWWNASESGWGVNITMQNEDAFATFFVYDAAQNPVWYVALLRPQGNFVWSGNLLAMKGPWFGGPFNTANVVARTAGTAQFAPTTLNQATFTYSVDGVNVVKNVTRTTWMLENYSGTYVGGYSIRLADCKPSSLNGVYENIGVVTVNQTGTNFSMGLAGGPICTYTGAYGQYGKLGEVQGTYTCADGTQGPFAAFEMTPTISGFNARVQGESQSCRWFGYFGALKRAP